jgi:hypothetical protein
VERGRVPASGKGVPVSIRQSEKEKPPIAKLREPGTLARHE